MSGFNSSIGYGFSSSILHHLFSNAFYLRIRETWDKSIKNQTHLWYSVKSHILEASFHGDGRCLVHMDRYERKIASKAQT